jgi:MFS transporter, PAT family, beta-lactamase induction signal transducer AmpG
MALRPLYLAIGVCGGRCTLGLSLLPPVPVSYAIVVIAENFFQSLAIRVSMAVILDTIGRDNPLASTPFCVVGSAYSLPIRYMLYVDSFGYAHGGIAGSL